MPKGIYKKTKGHLQKLKENSPFQKRHKINLGKKRKKYKRIRTKESYKRGGKKISQALRGKPKFWLRGKNHHNWKGGISKKYRNQHSVMNPKYKKWRLDVFTRDDFTCQICRKVGGYLQAHHIKTWLKYSKLRYKIDNGITLCVSCHKEIHKIK